MSDKATVSFGEDTKVKISKESNVTLESLSSPVDITLRNGYKQKRRRTMSATHQDSFIRPELRVQQAQVKLDVKEEENVLKSPKQSRMLKIGARIKNRRGSVVEKASEIKKLQIDLQPLQEEKEKESPKTKKSRSRSRSPRRVSRGVKRLSRNVNKEMGIVRNSDSDANDCKITLEDESQEGRWSSKEPIFDKWPKPDTTPAGIPLITRDCLKKGYNIEIPRTTIETHELSIIFMDRNTFYFKNLVDSGVKIRHYYQPGSDPVVLTIESSNNPLQKIIIRNSKCDIRVLITKNSHSKIIKALCKEYPTILKESSITKVKGEQVSLWTDNLLSYESKQISSVEKIGVVWAKDGQNTEDQFLNNDNPSPAFKKFLTLLGDEIELKGWKKFRGGLDAAGNSTGERSVYTAYKGFEIMFHVATMLPYNPNDEQQVCKKRHIGNDVVVIIFKENNIPFDPLWMRSQFNHVFMVVTPAMIVGQTHYSIEITTKPGVPPFPPYLSSAGVYPHSKEARDVILSKLINANRAAMFAKEFHRKEQRTRKLMLTDIITELCKNK